MARAGLVKAAAGHDHTFHTCSHCLLIPLSPPPQSSHILHHLLWIRPISPQMPDGPLVSRCTLVGTNIMATCDQDAIPCKRDLFLYEYSLTGCFMSMPGRRDTEMVALGPTVHLQGTPWRNDPVPLLGAAVPH